MRLRLVRRAGIVLTAMLAVLSCPPLSATAADRPAAPAAAAPPALDKAIAEYRRKLDEYTRAHQPYVAEAAAYWNSIAEKRRARRAKRASQQDIVLNDYVLTQPPVYSGPPEPINPEQVAPEAPPTRKYIPVLADFLKAAAEQFNFTPQLPQSEIEFKRAYAKVAAAAGLTQGQVVRIYGFESGGNGRYDVQAGLEYSNRMRARSAPRSATISCSTPTASSCWRSRAIAS